MLKVVLTVCHVDVYLFKITKGIIMPVYITIW